MMGLSKTPHPPKENTDYQLKCVQVLQKFIIGDLSTNVLRFVKKFQALQSPRDMKLLTNAFIPSKYYNNITLSNQRWNAPLLWETEKN